VRRRLAPGGAQLLALAGLSACVWPATSLDPANAAFAADPRAPDLALLEYKLEQHFANEPAQGRTTCATVLAEERPSVPYQTALPPEAETALIARFARLAPFGRCRWNGSRYVDAFTGGDAAVLVVEGLRCERPQLCTAWAGRVTTPAESTFRFYTVKYGRGVWRVGPANREIILT